VIGCGENSKTKLSSPGRELEEPDVDAMALPAIRTTKMPNRADLNISPPYILLFISRPDCTGS
jgi:hypothetical protein